MSVARVLHPDPVLLYPAPNLGRQPRGPILLVPESWPAEDWNSHPTTDGAAAETNAFEDEDHAVPERRDVILLTFSGSAALYQAAKLLDLGKGATVLCPAYNCGRELEPLLRNGASVRFYGVDRELKVDLEDVERKVDGARALLVTHYFGFPQDLRAIRRICKDHGILLLEDCAHAPFMLEDLSGGNGPMTRARPESSSASGIGTYGDAAIYSIRKTLPVPNGGALVVRSSSVRSSLRLDPPSRFAVAVKRLELLQKGLFKVVSPTGYVLSRIGLLALEPAFLARDVLKEREVGGSIHWWDPDDGKLEFDDRVLDWQMSTVAVKELESADFEGIQRVRRRNFGFLLRAFGDLPGATPLLPHLPPDVSPLCFPLMVEDPDAVVEGLESNGIEAARWWADRHPSVPWDDFPDAVHLKTHTIVLPIHQDVRPRHLERMAAALPWVLDAGRRG